MRELRKRSARSGGCAWPHRQQAKCRMDLPEKCMISPVRSCVWIGVVAPAGTGQSSDRVRAILTARQPMPGLRNGSRKPGDAQLGKVAALGGVHEGTAMSYALNTPEMVKDRESTERVGHTELTADMRNADPDQPRLSAFWDGGS